MSYQSVSDMNAALRSRRVSALELADQAIARIEALDDRLNAVVVRDFDRARQAARAADAALARGAVSDPMPPLLGIPMTVKESFNLAGLPTTWGLPGTEGNVAAHDAVAVGRLKAAGAVILGKTNVPVMLTDWQSFNPIYGATANPWDLARSPGGSSGGGAAALAAGYVPLEFGTDMGGSLRVPAHCCGVFAHKPTHGIVPMRGMAPRGTREAEIAAEVDFAVAGPMARCCADLALALDVTAGPDQHLAKGYSLALPEPRHARLRDFRVLVVDTHPLVAASDEIRAAIANLAEALAKAGCTVARETPLLPDLRRVAETYGRMLMAFVGGTMTEVEYAAQRRRVEALPEGTGDFDAEGERALVLSHRDWLQAHWQRVAIANQWQALFRAWDVVLCPILPTTAFPHDHRPMEAREIVIDGKPVPYSRLSVWAGPATLTGQPATAMPIGSGAGGLPIGMQIIGPHLEDRTTLAFAALMEREYGGFVPPPLAWA